MVEVRKEPLTGKHANTLRELVKAHPDATLAELRDRFQKATERDENEEVRTARCAYREEQTTLDARPLVFVDACGTQLQMTRAYARLPKGQRAD